MSFALFHFEQTQANKSQSVCRILKNLHLLATLAHILVSEGFLEYDKPIATYWPEFAQNGKEQMTLRHVISITLSCKESWLSRRDHI
jgi:hypothetical protein